MLRAGLGLAGKREAILAIALFVEVAVFSALGTQFFSRENLLEILRFSVELGLLALALTPVIVAGGIDLSVGSMLGLSAIVLGATWRDLHLPIGIAILCALVTGCVGGVLNAWLIAQSKLPPLAVTLGTYSLFRGIAEGLTQGSVSYSGFPPAFLYFGQGYLAGIVPVQLLLLLLFGASIFVLLHLSRVGRALYAIGFGAEGARYAGISVPYNSGLTYVLSGLAASMAGITYASHLGQAKADAGAGYELDAIAAIVMGGTSIFGGRGTILGTILGLSLFTVLQNGLHMSALPSELNGVLTGVLLISVIGYEKILNRNVIQGLADQPGEGVRGEMKNSQVAVVCATVLAGALIVAGTNVWLVRSLRPVAAAVSSGEEHMVIAMMPKAKGDPYFVSAKAGADEAAKELGIELLWDGPATLDAAKQNELIENWITRKVDAIAVAVENKASISTVLRKARERGIRVLTWDADAEPDARDYFVNQATPEGIAKTLTAEAARLLNKNGTFAIITGALTAANQNEWIRFIRRELSEKYPQMKLATIRPSDDDRDKAFAETQTLLRAFPDVKLVMAISAPAVPGAAEAVRQASRPDVPVIGLSLPSSCKPYIKSGVVPSIVLWSTRDLGYLTVYASALSVRRTLVPGAGTVSAGRLGARTVKGGEVILGEPMIINASNIDQMDF